MLRLSLLAEDNEVVDSGNIQRAGPDISLDLLHDRSV
jgi:hypothetical protein